MNACSATAQARRPDLPPVARLGALTEARTRLGRGELAEAWQTARAAIRTRPFHPEAWLLLAEIALAAGRADTARACAKQAGHLAPRWHGPKQFLRKPLPRNQNPDGPALDEPAHDGAGLLTVCVIARNEESSIGRCLESVQPIASQIIVVDTGSTDRTVHIARDHGAEVYAFAWSDDFSAARNTALEHATGQWVLMIDADEELPAAEHAHLRADLQAAGAIGYRLPLVNRAQEEEGRNYVPRLFRNAPGIHYFGRIHEQVFPSLLPHCRSWQMELRLGTAQLLHHGYAPDLEQRHQKIERNLRLLRLAVREQPGDPNILMNLGLELVRSGDLAGGLDQYRAAFRSLSAQQPADIVPELREVLLTQLAAHLLRAGQHEELVRALESPPAKRGGLTASLHFALGLARFELRQYAQAAEEMRHCLAKRGHKVLSPVNTAILTGAPYHCLAVSLARAGDAVGAEKAFQSALAQPGRTDRVKLEYARFLAAQRRPVDALRTLHELVKEDAANAAAWRLGGEIALSRPEFLEFALDWTGEALRYAVGDRLLAAQRAEALTLGDRVSEAGALWEQVCHEARSPRDLAAWILCSAANGKPAPQPMPLAASEEAAVSRAFVEWYQRLANAGARKTLMSLNSRTGALREVLPTAAGLLESAMAQAAVEPATGA